MRRALSCLCVSALLQQVVASSVWEAPQDLSLKTAAEHHEHSKEHRHNLTDVPFYKAVTRPQGGYISCPDVQPDPDAVAGMYAPHRAAAVSAMGAAPGDAVVLFGGDLEYVFYSFCLLQVD